jgi:peroxidase
LSLGDQVKQSMARNAAALLVSCVLLLVAASCLPAAAGYYKPPNPATCGLKVGYYHDKCPAAEAIVKHVVKAAVRQNRDVGAGIIRMLFHDCFVEVRVSLACKTSTSR